MNACTASPTQPLRTRSWLSPSSRGAAVSRSSSARRPGVGKTYAMLMAARAAKAEGRDVLVGIVETHGRAETEALLDGLDVLPRKPIVYVNRIMSEFDIDAALARRPELASASMSTPTPTSRAAATPSAGRTSRSCWRPASMCGPR